MTPELLQFAGQLLGLAVACGLNLYAAVAALGLASRFGWFDAFPHGLGGTEHGIILASAGLLFLVEFVVDKIRHVDSLWDTIHTFIRPTAAALLTFGAVAGTSLPIEIALAVLAGSVALATHATKAGLRLSLNARPSSAAGLRISIVEDLAAVGLALAAVSHPVVALGVAGAILLTLLLVGPRLWRAFHLGVRALIARIRGFFGHAHWRDLDELPRRLRGRIEPAAPGLARPRVARAAFHGLRAAGAYRNGWLVVTHDRAYFLFTAMLSPRRVELPTVRSVRVRPSPWADCLDLETADGNCTLFLLKDGPSAELVLADFTPIES